MIDDVPLGFDRLDEACAAAEAHRRYERALTELGEASRLLASIRAGRPLTTMEAVAALRRRERRGRG